MTPAFADLIRPIVAEVLRFREFDPSHPTMGAARSLGTPPDFASQRHRFLTLLANAEVTARNHGTLSVEFPYAKKALVYWIDEIHVPAHWWEPSARWKERTLELEIYGTRRAAPAFFEEGDQAQSLHLNDALETFLLCLSLGFRGIHAGRPDELVRWTHEKYAPIARRNSAERKRRDEEKSEAERTHPAVEEPMTGPLILLSGATWVLGASILFAATLAASLAVVIAAAHWR